jgi:hypothetical protein
MNAMNWTALSELLLSTQLAALPSSTLMRVALHLGWALVLGWGVMALSTRWPAAVRRALAGGVVAWTLMPSAASPAYWLGLAFQTPSLMTMLICGAGLWQLMRGPVNEPDQTLAAKRRPALWSLIGMALGWLLLLDTLALLPWSLYAWGFSPVATLFIAVSACLTGATGLFVSRFPARWAAGLPWLVLALFVLTRLPTGNVWDALIDPWLWIGLQLPWLIRGVRWVISKVHSAIAIPV